MVLEVENAKRRVPVWSGSDENTLPGLQTAVCSHGGKRPSLTSLEKAMAPPLQYSCLENPMDGGAW